MLDVRGIVSGVDDAVDREFEAPTARRWPFIALGAAFFGLAALFTACQPGPDPLQSLCTLFCEKYDYPVPLPGHVQKWLTKTPTTGTPSANVGADYYAAIDPNNTRNTLDKWKAANGFGQGDEVVTYYFNAGDLDYGREMHCRQATTDFLGPKEIRTACYVTNYGSDPDPTKSFLGPAVPLDLAAGEASVKLALDRAVAHDSSTAFATVAMESFFSNTFFSGGRNVYFYVFKTDGTRATDAALDSEGPKPVPVMCMSCHGGSYDFTSHQVKDASFLPFDLQSFRFSTTTGFTRADQEDRFRAQNQMVRSSGTVSDGIVRTINLMYPRGVQTPGLTAANDQIPPGWQGKGHDDLYLQVVRPYCRSCHQAQTPYALQYEWNEYAQFQAAEGIINIDVCGGHNMPHAEIPFFKFWQLNAVQRGPEPLQKWLASEQLTCVLPTPVPTPAKTP